MTHPENHLSEEKDIAILTLAARIATSAGDHIAGAMAAGTIEPGDEQLVISRTLEEIQRMAGHVLMPTAVAVEVYQVNPDAIRVEET